MNKKAERPWATGLAVGLAIGVPLGEYVAGSARYLSESPTAAMVTLGTIALCTVGLGGLLRVFRVGCLSGLLLIAALFAATLHAGPRLAVHAGQALIVRAEGPDDPRIEGAITLIETALYSPVTKEQTCRELTGFEIQLGAEDKAHLLRCIERGCGDVAGCTAALGEPDREWK